MKKIICALLLLSMVLCLFSCKDKAEGIKLSADEIKDVVEVEMSVKGYGKMTLELYHDIAPITVENFVSLTCEGFYDGTVFHRVMEGFMIQGGDDDGDGIGGSENTIKGEFTANGVANTLKHERGVISMARTSQSYDSASSQFFIMHAANSSLDGQYAAFGKVVEGIEVVDEIAAVETKYNSYGTERSVPTKDIVLEYVIVTKTYDRDGGDNTLETKSEEELYAEPVSVEISVEGHGKITLELYPNLAPITVENFVKLAKSGYYDGSVFHRIIEDFMIQGGAGEGGVASIKGEFTSNGVYNPLKHERGVISMARTTIPDSATSQFFIVHKTSPHLDGQYAGFGRVTKGIEVVDSIATVETDSSDAPLKNVVIEYVKVLETKNEDTTAADTTAADTTAADTTAAVTTETVTTRAEETTDVADTTAVETTAKAEIKSCTEADFVGDWCYYSTDSLGNRIKHVLSLKDNGTAEIPRSDPNEEIHVANYGYGGTWRFYHNNDTGTDHLSFELYCDLYERPVHRFSVNVKRNGNTLMFSEHVPEDMCVLSCGTTYQLDIE